MPEGLQVDSSQLLLNSACRPAEHKVGAVVVHARECIGKGQEARGVDAGRLSEVEDDLAVALIVDDVDQPRLQCRRAGALIESGSPRELGR
jgi:hypothetical protein